MTLVDCGGQVDAQEVYDFIAMNLDGVTSYQFKPRGIAAAALDFFLVLTAVASVAQIASVLWMAYDRFIVPRKRAAKESAGIYIAVMRRDGTVIDVRLGSDILTKDEFAHRLELVVGDANDPELRLAHETTISELENLDSWVKIDRE